MNELIDNFAILMEAPGSIKRLRQMILQLAVQGRLVAQHPNDEPASLLLERAKKVREELIIERNIKKSDLFSIIRRNDIPFNLPKSWQWAQIGEFALIQGGKRLPTDCSFSENPTPHIYIRVTNMKNGTIIDNSIKYIEQTVFEQISKYIIEKDDLYITIAGTIGDVGCVPERFDGMNLTENAAKIVFRIINKYYLKFVLNSRTIKEQFFEKMNIQAQPKLALKRISTAIVPIPPLAEQKRIVEKVDRLMALCDELEKQQEERDKIEAGMNDACLDKLLDSQGDRDFQEHWQRIVDHFDIIYEKPGNVEKLKQAILQLAVRGKLERQDPHDEPASLLLEKIKLEKERLIKEGKLKPQQPLPPISEEEIPYTIPNGWQWVRLGRISKNIHYGYTASADSMLKKVKLLRITDIQNDNVNWDSVPGCEISAFNLKSFELNNGDLLIARTGGTIGKTYLVQNLQLKAVFASYLIRIVPSCYVYPMFLKVFSGSSLYWNQLYSKCTGTGQPNVNGRSLSSLILPMPPFAEQERIVEKVDRLMALCDRLAADLKNSQTLREKLFQAVASKL